MGQKTLHDCAGLPQDQEVEFASTNEECGYRACLNQNLSIAAGMPEAYTGKESNILPLAMVERIAIDKAIAYCDGNIQQAALLLEVAASTIYRKINSWK